MIPRLVAGLLALALAAGAAPVAAQSEPSELTEAAVIERDTAVEVWVRLSRPVKYHSDLIDSPWRLVLDFEATAYRWTTRPLPVGIGPVRELRGSQYRVGVARLVIELRRKTAYTIEQDREGLRIVLPREASAEPAGPAPAPAPPSRPRATPPATPPVATAAKPGAAAVPTAGKPGAAPAPTAGRSGAAPLPTTGPPAPVPVPSTAPLTSDPSGRATRPRASDVAAKPDPAKPGTARNVAGRPAPRVPATPPGPRLHGVIVLDQQAHAYIWDPESRQVRRYAVGDAVGDSLVEAIGERHVVLRTPAGRVELRVQETRPALAPGGR